jgi:hypothetical protein
VAEDGQGASADPGGVALSLTGASRDEADAYLREQRLHLAEDIKQIDLRIRELRLGVLLRLATLCVGLAAAGGVSVGP